MQKGLTTRKLQSLQSRQRIFDASITLIKEKGFDQVSIEEICEKAHVSKGLFYNYFDSKDAIIRHEFLEIDNEYRRMAGTLKGKKGIARLKAVIRRQDRFIRNSMGWDLVKNVYRSLITNTGDPILKKDRYFYTLLVEIARECQEAGEIRKDLKAEEVANQIAILMRGIIYNLCLYEESFSYEEMATRIILTYLSGLRPDDSSC